MKSFIWKDILISKEGKSTVCPNFMSCSFVVVVFYFFYFKYASLWLMSSVDLPDWTYSKRNISPYLYRKGIQYTHV